MADTLTLDNLVTWVGAYRDLVVENKDYLTELDSAIGDADHGANLARGMSAAADAIAATPPATVGELGKKVGMTLVSTVGGASGPLLGTLFMKFGASAGDATELDAAGLAAAMRAGYDGVVARGKAERGDKTMLDAFGPAVDALEAAAGSGASASDAVSAGADAAEAGSDATEPLVAKKGRASYLGERSAGHIDPGSASTAMLWRTLAQTAAAA